MTKERYTFEREKIITNTACRIYDNDEILFEVNFDSLPDMNSQEVKELCDKLNEQDAEIKKLKKEILWWKYKCEEYISGDE